MKISMKIITLISAIITVTMIILYIYMGVELFETLYITFGTIFYHLFMRLTVGFIFEHKYKNNINYQLKWFKVSKIEYKIYSAIKVKHWKKYLPTYNPEHFNIYKCKYESIAMAMCQAELVHETIFLFSFLPIVAAKWFSSIEIFIITSFFSAIIDLFFIVVQRYNRARIFRLMKTN